MNNDEVTYSVSITKEELASLPIERYDGKIVVVATEATAEKAIAELRAMGTIGFDTETKPSFKKGNINQVALIQLAGHDKCFLFRLSKMGFPDVVKDFLEDESVTKIGLSIKDDFLSLSRYRNFEPKGFVDLQQYVKEFKIKDNSLSKINALIFGKRISKGQQLSNWEASKLSDAQKHYAALDAKACLEIYTELQKGEFIPELSPYYRKNELPS